MIEIDVQVNGEGQRHPAGTTVAELVDGLGRGRHGIAVCVGDEVVPRAAWPERRLRDGDEIEVLTAVQGG